MSDNDKDQSISVWKVLSGLGRGVAKGVQAIGEGTSQTIRAVDSGQKAVRNTMAITEITTIFNTTDKTVRFINRETARDTKEVLGQTAGNMKPDNTSGVWIPWFDPPRFGDFSRRHLEIMIDEIPVVYIWQKGDYIYWTNRLDAEGRPAKAYKMAGVSHVGGKRTLVIRNDPEAGYSVFLSTGVDGNIK